MKCLTCRKEFVPTGNNQKYCSTRCRDLAKNFRNAEKRKALRRQQLMDSWRLPPLGGNNHEVQTTAAQN